MKIEKFTGEHQFLSNFWPSEVAYDFMVFPTVEHAFAAAKTNDPDERALIQLAESPGIAKKLGRKVKLREDWESEKVGIMTGLIHQKFQVGSELAGKLMATGQAELIEGNWWGDTFWGVCKGKGENWLGVILMKRREQLQT